MIVAIFKPRLILDVDDGRNNNFDLIRIVAAIAVLLSHSYPIALGPGASEPLARLTGYTLGTLAVGVFFAISGYLIVRSFERRRDARLFIESRCLRIFPGLAVVLIATLFFIGIPFTELPVAAFLGDRASWTYVPRNLSLFTLQYDLPAVFTANPYGPAINGSLWTLKHEVVCYAAVFVAGMVGALHNRKAFVVGLALYVLFYVAVSNVDASEGPLNLLAAFRYLSSFFVFGAAFYVFRDRIFLDVRIALGVIALAVAAHGTPVYEAAVALCISYLTLFFAFWRPDISNFYRPLGDYSYGVYIYAFPIQQLVVHLVPGISPVTLFVVAFPPVLLCAAASWHLVEKRSLSFVRRRQSDAPPALHRVAGND